MEISHASQRFATITEADIECLQRDRDAKSTNRVVNRATRLFQQFIGDENSIEEMSKSELNQKLRLFYAAVRKRDGGELKKKSLDSLKYGIAKYLKDKCDMDINCADFNSSHEVYRSKVKQLKRTGYGSVDHKPVIGDSDLAKLNNPDNMAFNVKTPCGLQQKVWFDIMYFLVRRGQENLRNMTKETFAVAIDSSGRRFVYQVVDEADKNHDGNAGPDDTVGEGKMYSREDDPLCPVRCFELYLSKLHPELSALWQRPLDAFDESNAIWYYKAAVGRNTLAKMMSTISKQAKLSKLYTNHSIRATAITQLDNAGFEARHIMRASGHRSEASIRSYSSRLTEPKQREMSDCLSKPLSSSNDAIPGILKELSEQDLDSIFSNENEFLELPQQSETALVTRKGPCDTSVMTPGQVQLLPSAPVVNLPSKNFQQENIQQNLINRSGNVYPPTISQTVLLISITKWFQSDN